MAQITIYEKPTCSTCRRAVALLKERTADFTRVNYFEQPLSEAQLADLLRQANLRPRDVVRLKEPGARELPLEDDGAVLRALVQRPDLLQRPLVQRGERVVLARPPERVLELLDQH